MKKIKIVGMGYVGQTLAAVMAEAEFTVYGIDEDSRVIDAMKNRKSHVHETGLNEILEKRIDKNLFAGKWQEFESDVDVIVIAVPTPFDKKTRKPNLSYVETVLQNCAKTLKKGQTIILRSTVPLGTTRNVAKTILERSGLVAGKDFYLAFAPERTIQGAALRELTILPQIIGGINAESVQATTKIFEQITPIIVPVTSLEAAEMIKLVDNSFRDVKFAYANELAELCEKANLNAFEVIRSANRGYQRNNIPLPSPGVGGGCLTKDPHIFASSAAKYGQELTMIENGRQVNEAAPKRIAERLKKFDISDKTVLICGFAFKGEPPTNDMRESPTLDLVTELKGNCKNILGYDPLVEKWKIEGLGLKYIEKLKNGIESADVAVFMINHKEFLDPEISKLFAKMPKNAVIVDGWGLFDKRTIEAMGIKYIGVGIGDNY